MNSEQMDKEIKLKEAIVNTNLEIMEAYANLSPEDQQLYFDQVQQMIDKTEKLIKE